MVLVGMNVGENIFVVFVALGEMGASYFLYTFNRSLIVI